MTELLTAAQMRSLEQAAINSGEVTGLELMERAGHGVVEAVFEEWPDLARTSHRAVVLCGPGNNGGDGFVVARLLKQRGWEVEVFLYGDPDKLPPDARVNYERAQPLVETKPWNADAIERLLDTHGQALVVDAVFGTGLTRPLPTDVSSTTGSLNASIWDDDMHCVAIDLPSGLCADSGRELGARLLRQPDRHLPQTQDRALLGRGCHDVRQGRRQGYRPWQEVVARSAGSVERPDAKPFENSAPMATNTPTATP